MRDENLVEFFESAVLAQVPIEADHYDSEYFSAEWRDGENRYDSGTRRRIEGRQPQLIKDIFAPKNVLDLGCGPGFLMQFLQELGLDVTGIDFTSTSLNLAPVEVRNRIHIGDITQPIFGKQTFDLVICREVLEHLTVLQVRKAVAQICRASSRFIYVTTRFHPNPQSILDFTTQFEVDPSHITLLAKDFLRCLFVLEGFRRRPDLEARMDWAKKNRVLVYERTNQ